MTTAPRDAGPAKLPEQIPALDGLRGIAVVLVLAHHFLFRAPSATRLEWALHWLTSAAWIGVDLFFVLSGFLITRILLRAKGSPRFFTAFYGRRVLRIFPLYYLLLAVILVVMPALSSDFAAIVHRELPNPITMWTYSKNIVDTIHRETPPWFLFGHFWSLMVEEHFYLVWPFLVWLLAPRGLLKTTAAMVVAALGLRLAMLASGVPAMDVYVFSGSRVDALAWGAILAILSETTGLTAGLARGMRVATAAAVVGLLVVARHDVALFSYGAWTVRVGLSLTALAWAGVLVEVLRAPASSVPVRVLSSRPMAFAGKYSYGVYVYHYPLKDLVFEPLGVMPWLMRATGSHLVGVALYFAVSVAACFAIAVVSYELVESRFLKLKRYFEYRTPAARPELQPRAAAMASSSEKAPS